MSIILIKVFSDERLSGIDFTRILPVDEEHASEALASIPPSVVVISRYSWYIMVRHKE